ncbi:uncharacterized protein LOC130051726 isoform X4 [Ostrea edulis]|uniref:uncharacterized protein LOC130051726 isoform X4 n=1 Tax=Ostrea edulis TaxID=37623 RepID=UPI0024AFFE20|nr:uncharacterized protein LOC130051726 isoform X4 [Ostrea edulis]
MKIEYIETCTIKTVVRNNKTKVDSPVLLCTTAEKKCVERDYCTCYNHLKMSFGIYSPVKFNQARARGSLLAPPLNIDTKSILLRKYGRYNNRWPTGRKSYCSSCTKLNLEKERMEKEYYRLKNTISDQLRDKEIEVIYRTEAILDELRRNNYRLKERLSDTEEELKIRAYIIRERNVVETHDDRVLRLQQRYHTSLRDNEELERQIQKKENHLWSLRWEVRDLESEKISLEEVLAKREEDIWKLNHTLHQTQQKNILCRFEIKKIEDKYGNLYASFHHLQMENISLQKKISDMEHSIMFADKKEIEELKNNLHKTSLQISRIEEEKEELNQELNNLKYEQELDRRKTRYSTLSEMNDSTHSHWVQRFTELQKENQTVIAKNSTLEEEIRNLRRKYIYTENVSKSEMKDLRDENSELKNRIKEAEDTWLKPTPSNQTVAVASDILSLRQELTDLRKKNKELEEELRRRLQEKNDKTLMHESVIRQKDSEILKAKESLGLKDFELRSLQSKSDVNLHSLRFPPTHEEGIRNRNKQLEEELRNVKTENQNFRKHISTLQKENDIAIARHETTLSELTSLKVEDRQRQVKSQELEERLAKEERKAEKLRKELSEEKIALESGHSKTELELKNSEVELKEKRRDVQQLQERIRYKENEMTELLEGRNNALRRKAEVEQENQHLNDNLNQLQVENKNLQQQHTQLNKKISQTEQQLSDMNIETERLEERIAQLATENNQLRKDIAEVSKEKDNVLTRLSKVAGAKLTQGNAAITDLSDTNRPTKLAEKFSELYDNQWTDAFEELDNTFNNEEETIQALLKILQDAYTFCDRTETNYETRIRQAAFTLSDENTRETRQITGADAPVQKALTELILSLSNACCLGIEEMFLTRLPSILKEVDVTVSTKTKMYARHCASLCWRMRIREPPVFVRFEFRRGTEFKTDILRRYTKTGGYLDFIVWPALYLHENGPVLAKGVAQPRLSP